ncbi:MAG: TonB-dependent receptor [Litorimonas sp.]
MTKPSNLDRRLLLGVASFAMLMPLAPAYAQVADAPADLDPVIETEDDEVVATGIRQAIEDSLNLKRRSTSLIEAITAEDIGKLPDVSIADSLARLPGVTAQRVRGRAQAISIRGLGPDFSIALLNGREQVSASNNRGIEFDVFPSELIGQGVVYKTPDARLATTGIAGAVDLRTIKPLDYTDRQVNASARYIVNDNGSLNPDFGSDGYRLFGSYIDQNEDGTLGWNIGVTHQSNPTQFLSRELKTNEFQTSQLPDGTYYASDNPRTGVVSRDFERTSVAGTLQFEPHERFAFTVDGYYSDFADKGIFRGVETPIASWSGANLISSTGSGDFVDSATYGPAGAILRTDTEGSSAEIYSIGANLSVSLTERLRFTLDAARSDIEADEIDYESYAGTATGALFGPRANDAGIRGTLTYNTPANGAYSIDSSIDYSNPNNVRLADPGGWGQVGFIKEPNISDELNQIRAELEYDLGGTFDLLDSFAAGVLFTDREKNFDSNEAFLRAGAGFNADREAPVPDVIGTTDSGSIGLDIVAYDPTDLLGSTYTVDPANSVLWNVSESINTVYGMINIDGVVGVPVRGNIGAQYVDVTQKSSTGGGVVTDSYGDFLPSANLSFEVTPDTYLRLAGARSVTRPRMDQLRATGNFNFNPQACLDTDANNRVDTLGPNFDPGSNQVCFSFGGGNPFLRPFRSTAFDISVEKYFSEAGAISIALFTKDVDDYVVDSSEVIDAGAAVSDLIEGSLASNPDATLINLSGPVNAESATLQGFELALRLPLDDIYGPLEGFGVNAAYTYTDNDLEFMGQDIPIPGYSKETFSGEVYYENNGWRARVNTRYRSGFLSEIQQFDGSLDGQQALSELLIDAQIGYEFQSGKLEGLSITFDAFNLTDEPFRTENDLDGPNNPGTATFVSRREDYGTTYNFTVAKKF